MSRPLPQEDPARLGPFQLTARLGETPAGIIYLGVDPAGCQVSVAVMTRGAAGDAAARDRFRAAIVGADPGEVPPVVAAEPEGPTPWVATAYDPGGPGAERFLDAVLLKGTFGERGGRSRLEPRFQPYWAGSPYWAGWRKPAVGAPEPAPTHGHPLAERPAERGPTAAVITVAALLGLLLLLLLLLLYACRPVQVRQPVPTGLPTIEQFPPVPPPIPTRTPTSRPSPTQTGAPDEGGPL